ncbi:hypothetical protein V8G54_000597 [Vigna mungo]|uniref:Uncharacterized protein n=1 Tax=Vigna mungo TaxID=3915 RepID=A0AAQ3SA43_VIGMU
MCSFSSEQQPYLPLVFAHHPPSSSKRLHFSLHKRRRAQVQEERRRKKMILKTEMKMRNLKLYMENQSIIEENEKLRKKALLLHKENQTLLFQLQEKVSQQKLGGGDEDDGCGEGGEPLLILCFKSLVLKGLRQPDPHPEGNKDASKQQQQQINVPTSSRVTIKNLEVRPHVSRRSPFVQVMSTSFYLRIKKPLRRLRRSRSRPA